MKIKTIAAIDIGSNAIRLLINNVEYESANKSFRKAAFLRVPIRLGEDVFSEGQINEEKKHLFIEAMIGFSHLMKAYKVEKYKACATSAMRDAKNGNEITEYIKTNSGIEIEIIDGKEEAEYIYKAGGLNSVADRNENYLYVDVGGGSTEILVYSGNAIIDFHSFQLGTVRMLSENINLKEIDILKEWLAKVYKKCGPLSMIASGGNINKVHKLLGKREREPLKCTEIKVLHDDLKELTFHERMQNYNINTYRADVIVPALKIFITICKACKINNIYVPKVGLVDGIIHHLSEEGV